MSESTIEYRSAGTRGQTRIGGLNSHHSFSFGHWDHPQRRQFSALRVLNDDIVAGGSGFPPHPHANMEILSYVLEGALTHQDDLGNQHVIAPGDVQIMSAGTGITHSEMNAHADRPVHFLQIWITPDHLAATPRYAQRQVDPAALQQGFTLIAGGDSPVPIRQDARVLAAWPQAGHTSVQPLQPDRWYYCHMARGSASINDHTLHAGDALTLRHADALHLQSNNTAEVLLFDLPAATPEHAA